MARITTMRTNKTLKLFLSVGHASRESVFPEVNQDGTSIVEVMIAIVIFMIVMVGGLNYFTLPQSTIARQKMKRLAIAAAQKKMESIAALNNVTTGLNESSTPDTLGTLPVLRTTTVTEVDDPADGLGGSDSDGDVADYNIVTVEIDWNNDGNAHQVCLTTKVSKFAK